MNSRDFSGLGTVLKAMYNRITGKVAPNHAALAAAIDNVYRTAGDVDAVRHYIVSASAAKLLAAPEVKAPVATFCHLNKISPDRFFPTLVAAIDLIRIDADHLDKNFAKLFADLKTVDDVKVTHAYIFGYLTLAEKTLEFFSRTSYLMGVKIGEHPPKYLAKALNDDVAIVAPFVKTLLTVRTPGRRTIMDDLGGIALGAKNFFVFGEDQTLDAFADAADYLPQVSMALAHGFSLNPAIWVITKLLNVQRARYERNVKMREWLITRVALLELESAGMGDTAEYQKKQAVLAAYTTLIAGLDKKISEYENDA